MDAMMLNEIKLLELNKTKIKNGIVYDLLIHSIKGKYQCEEKRKNFVISRTLPNDKNYQSNYIEPFAKDFLNCYDDMLKVTKEKCQNPYKAVHQCLTSNHGSNFDFPVKCVSVMEDYLNC